MNIKTLTFILAFLGFMVASYPASSTETCATFAGTSPPVAGSTGTLILTDIAQHQFRWISNDNILGPFDSGIVNATRWVVAGNNPIRIVFEGTAGGVFIRGDTLLQPYSRAVVDLASAAKRIRYLVKPPIIAVTNVVFDHKGPDSGNSDGLNILKKIGDEMEHRGNGIGGGEWIKGSRNEPALYVASMAVTIKAKLTSANPFVTKADVFATAKAGILPNVSSTTVNFVGGVSNPEFVEFSLDRATDNKMVVALIDLSIFSISRMRADICQYNQCFIDGAAPFETVCINQLKPPPIKLTKWPKPGNGSLEISTAVGPPQSNSTNPAPIPYIPYWEPQ
jgi:hypothetical protein